MEITVNFKKETEKAVLLLWEGDEYWVPKSVITVYGEWPTGADDEVEVEIEDWFAEKQGWV